MSNTFAVDNCYKDAASLVKSDLSGKAKSYCCDSSPALEYTELEIELVTEEPIKFAFI